MSGGTARAVIGVLGGSGVYDIAGLANKRWVKVDSPFGEPSDELLFGDLDGQPMVFLPRHGRGHRIAPHEINFRANIDALKRSGVTDLVSVSAVRLAEGGTAARHLRAGRPVHRPHLRARQELLRRPGWWRMCRWPIRCARGSATSSRRQPRPPASTVRGGTYLVMEGPQFSTQRRIAPLSVLGLRRDRHDQHARGQARPRGRDLLRHASPW